MKKTKDMKEPRKLLEYVTQHRKERVPSDFSLSSLPAVEAATLPKKEKLPFLLEKGDTLWTISIQYYGAGEFWKKIARDNSLRQPNIILPGMRLVMLH